MKLKSHILQGVVLSPIVYYLTDIKSAVIFLLSFIFIDIDHYFLYIYRFRKFIAKGMFKYFDEVSENYREGMCEICVFHTVEVFLLLFISGYWRKEFWVVLIGFFTHQIFDIYYLFKRKALYIRAFSFVEYFIRKRYSKRRLLMNKI